MLERTLNVIASCSCENGCPACVHSPKCGSGNRPIDKISALKILELMKKNNVGSNSPGPVNRVMERVGSFVSSMKQKTMDGTEENHRENRNIVRNQSQNSELSMSKRLCHRIICGQQP